MQLKSIQTNKGPESHIAGLYTQGPRMIFLTVQWNPVNTVTNGSKKFGRVKTINGVTVLPVQAQIS